MSNRNYFLLFLSLAFILTLSSCGKPTGCDISGKVEGGTYAHGVVYLKDATGLSIIDSTLVKEGTFRFKKIEKDSTYAALLVLMSSPNDMFPSFLPVVIEPGNVKAHMGGNLICISGSPLNEKMQDFLENLDKHTTQSFEHPQAVAEARRAFAIFLNKQIEQNKDNAVGEYIRRAYSYGLNIPDSISSENQ